MASITDKAKEVVQSTGEALGLTSKPEDRGTAPVQTPGFQTSSGPQASSKESLPGESKGIKSQALEAAEVVVQRFAPINSIHQHVCAFHFYAHDMTRQVEAHHYCAHPNEEIRQCVLYDSDQPNARLIGIEYIISERLFTSLPKEECIFWHSHNYEVGSGMLQAPRVPDAAENEEMRQIAVTYGKVFHTWQVDRGDTLPIGPPQLMMAFKEDGQLDPEAWAARDARYGSNSEEKRQYRQAHMDIPEKTHPDADHWMKGDGAWQLEMVKKPFKSVPEDKLEANKKRMQALRAGGFKDAASGRLQQALQQSLSVKDKQ
jgi:hypothetical protein